jgi:hypothetical protein
MRVQELCLMRFQEGNARRTRVSNLVNRAALRRGGRRGHAGIHEQVRKAFTNLQASRT